MLSFLFALPLEELCLYLSHKCSQLYDGRGFCQAPFSLCSPSAWPDETIKNTVA